LLNKLQLHQQYLHAVPFPCLLGFLHMENLELWIENSCFKDLCIRICPEVSSFNSVIEEEQSAELLGGPVEPSLASTWTILSEDLHGLSSSGLSDPYQTYKQDCGAFQETWKMV
jgi:hypothetical protein